jgi:hypothetical protein
VNLNNGKQPTSSRLYSIGCIGSNNGEYVSLNLDVSNESALLFLLDSGADVSLLKSKNLIGTVEYEPKDRIRVKSVDGSVIESHGSIDTRIREGNAEIPFTFQLVSKQVDVSCDGILGRDFLQQAQAQICFKTGNLTFQYEGFEIRKELVCRDEENSSPREGRRGKGMITLPKRSEVIVKLPVVAGTTLTEGLIEKKEIQEGVYMAGSLTKVAEGHIITSILNTRDEELEIVAPIVKVEKLMDDEAALASVNTLKQKGKFRESSVLEQLRTEHLNPEEKASLQKICSDYHDVFYLPGDKLSCTDAVKHSINLVPGTAPINTRPYRLPEAQKQEVDRQVTKLLREGIIEESNSPWNSPILVVPKKVGVNGEQKWRLVIDFRRLNEKTVGDAYPLPDITEILDQLGQSKIFLMPGYGDGLPSDRVGREGQRENGIQYQAGSLGV